MRVRRHPPALLCYALALSQAFWGLGCQDRISGSGAGASSTLAGVLASQDIGAVVFGLWREQITHEPAGAARDARLAALDGRRSDFVRAVNDIVNVRTVQGVAQTADALFALVDDGTLPALADHAAAVLDLLLQDPAALDALVDLARQQPRGSHAALPPRELVSLLGRVANYPDSEALWTAVARLIEENDGHDAQGNRNGEPTLVHDLLALGRDALNRAATAAPTATQGRLLQAAREVLGAMTEEAQVRGTFDFGHPEWVARVDARGLPRVALDPATGRLFAPFVDDDGDGLADADPAGAFVDAAGQAVDRPVFGRPGDPGFDAEGRAVTGGGALLYEYADAKRTILALTAKLGGDLLAREVDERACRVLEAGLGPVLPDGTYGRDHPVADLAWGALSLLEDDGAPTLLRAAQHLLQRDPAAAERLIVTLARGHEAARLATRGSPGLGSARLSDPRVVQLLDDLMPILDDLLEQPSNGGRSTGLVVVDTLIELGTRAPDFGPQLAPLFLYRRVERETVPDGDRNTIDEARSTPVDHGQPAWIGAQDNRSAVHQLLDLLARNDGCQLFGRSISVWIIDQMADLSPATVGTLASLVNALPGFLTNILCPGTSQDVQALDALARSGALDGFLPLAKAFKDQGETELLVRLLVRLQRSYAGTLREVERDVAAILDAGALEELEAALALARQVRDPLTGEPATETIARALGDLVDVDRVVVDRRGQRVPSRAHLLLRPLQELDRRVVAAGRAADMTAVADGLFEVVLAREVVNGVELLRNGSTIPLVARTLDAIAAALPPDAATRAAEVDLARRQVEDALASKDLAVVLQLLRTIEASPHKQTIRRSIVNLLTPNRAVQHDIFGAIVRLAVIALSLPRGAVSLAPLQALAPFLARVVDPHNPVVPDTLRAIERLLTADQGQTTLNLVRAALNPAPGELDPPAAVLLDVAQEVSAAGGGAGGALDRVALEETLRRLAAFIRDDASGLGYLFALIAGRQR